MSASSAQYPKEGEAKAPEDLTGFNYLSHTYQQERLINIGNTLRNSLSRYIETTQGKVNEKQDTLESLRQTLNSGNTFF